MSGNLSSDKVPSLGTLQRDYVNEDYDPLAERRSHPKNIAERESAYNRRRFLRDLPQDSAEEIKAGPSVAAAAPAQKKRSRWGQALKDEKIESSATSTMSVPQNSNGAEVSRRKRSRWDQAPPKAQSKAPVVVPQTDHNLAPEDMLRLRLKREMEYRNRPLTDQELDAILPKDGYAILDPPASYAPRRTAALSAPSTEEQQQTGFFLPEARAKDTYGIPLEQHNLHAPSGTGDLPGDLPALKPEDYQYFGKLLEKVDVAKISLGEARERQIMTLILMIKNGASHGRKRAFRKLTKNAREFGAGPLFNLILPLLMSPTLEDQERHYLVKAVHRIMQMLGVLVRPYTHKILVVIEPLLIDENYFARVEGREIIANLAKASGLATMISTMRPDIDNADEYVRNTTARAFAVVASALGVPSLVPFLNAVCHARKSCVRDTQA